jgi:hypothetical protein
MWADGAAFCVSLALAWLIGAAGGPPPPGGAGGQGGRPPL